MRSPLPHSPASRQAPLSLLEHANIVLVTFLLHNNDGDPTATTATTANWDALKNITVFGPNSKCFSPLEVEETDGSTSFCMAFPIPDTVSPLKTAIQQFEDLTKLTYSSGFLRILVGTPFSIPVSGGATAAGTKVHPFLLSINRTLAISHKIKISPDIQSLTSTGATTKLIDLSTHDFLQQALQRCTISPALEASIERLRNDHTSGAGRLANLAVKEFAMLCASDPELLSRGSTADWWITLRLYGWHLFHSRPSMSSSIQNRIIRILQQIHTALPTLPVCSKQRAEVVSSLILTLLKSTRTKSYTIPQSFSDLVRSLPRFVDARENKRLFNILVHSNSSVMASSLVSLFHLKDRPRIRVFVLESRPLFEGVTLARHLRDKVPQGVDAGGDNALPAVTVEVAVDAAVGNYTKVADLYVLAADRIYPNGDVSNKIGCLTAALGMRFNERRSPGNVALNGGSGKSIIVIGATDKVCGKDERDRGWDYSYEENDGGEYQQN
ncbi:Ribose 1,5-bisphosphate isomerase [Drechslerella dactyloides]|uniref:Ribose 1,5-bisphosphate isomerase n=1 Tax=Drechslerella dactyloides TaxID=74499 RepID=A0AAD6IZG1_DREDA|nr:Ribose 1,5-bisphosphate isomerase [Drechslerella dactyloides]